MIEMNESDHHSDVRRHRPNVELSGSYLQSLYACTVLAYCSRSSSSAFNPPIAIMPLTPTQRILLAISPVVPTILIPIPLTWRVHQTGGKKEVLIMTVISVTGMAMLTALSQFTEIPKIDAVDWRYYMMLTSGFFIGHGAAAYYSIIDTFKGAAKKENISKTQKAYSFIVDSAFVSTPPIVFYLNSFGYVVPFSIFTSIAFIGAAGALVFLKPSPYNQFKEHHSPAEARELAIRSGQLESLIGVQDQYTFCEILKENIKVLFDRRGFLLNVSLWASLASSWFTRLILPSVLVNGYNLSQTEATIISSSAYLLVILSRPIADKMTARWDKQSGGVKVHVLGCVLTILGSLALTYNLSNIWLYAGLAAFNIGSGVSLATPANIALIWSKPINEKLENFNPSTMFSLFATLGNLGSIVLPLFLGLMVDQSGIAGYQNYFYIIVGMMLISAITIPIIDRQVRNNPPPVPEIEVENQPQNHQQIRASTNRFAWFSPMRSLTANPAINRENVDLEANRITPQQEREVCLEQFVF